ncbi:unnamed protein product, partial [Vitis vinifera]
MEILLSQFSRESFGKLRVLEIKACHDVLVVIPSSKLQVLHNLKQLIVRNCSSVKEVIQVEEIVENEGGEATDDKIVFTKLKKLKLHFLPNLKSFCSARYTFIFPCLTEMQVKRCPEMEIFCKGDSITQRLEKVLMSDHRPCWEIDLNTTIQKMFMETVHYYSPDFLLPLTTSFPFTILYIL